MKTGLRKVVASKAKNLRAQAQPKVVDEVPAGAPQGQPSGQAPKPPAGGGGGPSAFPSAPAPGDKEKEEEKPEEGKDVEKLEESIEKLSDGQESMVKAIEDMKKIVEKALLGKTDSEEGFEDLKEEDKKEEEEAFSAEEFGVDPESLIVSKEEKMAKSLREARKERLQKQAAAAEGPSDTLSEELGEDKAKKKTFKPSAPAPTITKVKKSEVPEMLKLANLVMELNEDSSKWVVLQAAEEGPETPLYEIEMTEENKENFATEEFAEKIFKEMENAGVEKTLAKLNAKKIEAQDVTVTVPVPEATSTEPAEAGSAPEQAEEEKTQEKPDDYKRRFARAFRLSLSAMNKNLTDTNPLKFSLFAALDNFGLDASDLKNAIEAAFSMGAAPHFEEALAQTEKYLEMSDEGFVEAESTIGELETKIPELAPTAEPKNELSEKAIAARVRAKKASLLLSTQSDSDPSDKAQRLFEALPKPKLAHIRNLVEENDLGR